jgi:hypothetical protein
MGVNIPIAFIMLFGQRCNNVTGILTIFDRLNLCR